jgi:hypothetical protein
MIGKVFWLLTGACFAALVSGIAMPVIWLMLRLVGLVDLLLYLFKDVTLLMRLGGFIFGVLVGALFIVLMTRTFGDVNKLGLIFGALGGAVGGIASSIMFFPLVAIL